MRKSSRVLVFKILLAVFAAVLIITPGILTHVPDIEQQVLVSVLGIDVDEKEGYKLSAQIVVPKRATEGEPEQVVIDSTGKSVSQTIDKLNRALGRNAALGHCGVIVIGSKFAEQGIRQELEYLFAGGIVTPGTNLVCVMTDAADFLKDAVGLATGSVTGLDSFITYASTGAHTATLNVNRFLSASEGESKTSFMPIIKLDKGDGEEAGGEQAQPAASQSGGGGQQNAHKTTIKCAECVAVFVAGKKVVMFDEDLTRGVVWTDKQSERGQVQLDEFSYDGVDYGGQYAMLKYKKRKYKAAFEDGKPVFTVKLNVKLDLEDKHGLRELGDAVGTAKAADIIQAAFRDKIEKEIRQTYAAGLECGADIFEVRSAFYRTAFDAYKAYGKDLFMQDVELRCEIKVKVM